MLSALLGALIVSATAYGGVQLYRRYEVNQFATNMDELQKGGYLASAFTDVNQRGGPIKLTITLEPGNCVGAKCLMAVRAYPGGSIRDVDGRPDPAIVRPDRGGAARWHRLEQLAGPRRHDSQERG